MGDGARKPGFPDSAVDRFTSARLAVEAVSEQVDEVGRHFKEAVNAPRKSGSFLAFLEDRTRAAPLTMLGLAFAAGVIFVRRR